MRLLGKCPLCGLPNGEHYLACVTTYNEPELKMEELDSYRMRDGGILSLQAHGNGLKWVVAYYNRADIEEWAQEYENLEAATRQFEYRKRTDKGPKDNKGVKR